MATATAAASRQGMSEDETLPVDAALDRRQPVADQVYAALRDAILTVRLLPGTSISENRLCRHFGVSRTPARAAVSRLADEGLIEVYPQQGSFVAPIRLSRMETSRFVRRALETAIMVEAVAAWRPAMSLETRAIIETQREAVEAGDLDLFYRQDMAFHQAFCRFAGREGVWDTIAEAISGLGRLVRLNARPERLPVVIVEHAAIVDAMDAGDAAEAVRRLEGHLDQMFAVFGQLSDALRGYVAE